MNRTTRILAAVLVGAGLLASGAPAFSADEDESDKFCPMGGTLIKVEVDKEKAIAWGKDRRKVEIKGEDNEVWSVLTLSSTDNDIAIVLRPGSVFFGIAGRGREVGSSTIDKTYGNGLRGLRDAIRKEMGDLRQDDIVKIEGSDVQALSDAAGLGVLQKDGRDWELKLRKCDATDVDVSGL